MMSQYFDNDKSIKSNKKLIEFNFNNKKYNVYSDNGVFSKDKFDYGTRVLLESIDINNLCGKFINDTVSSVDKAVEGACYIIAEWISDNAYYRKYIRSYIFKNGTIVF